MQVRCPVRILHGLRDRLVPPAVSQELMHWLETTDVTLTLTKDGDHRLSRPQDLRTLLLTVTYQSRTCVCLIPRLRAFKV